MASCRPFPAGAALDDGSGGVAHRGEDPRVSQPGAVVVGGDYQGLGIVRSLGRRGIPVCVIDDERSIARHSRYTTHALRVGNLRDERVTVDTLMDVGRRLGLNGWVLYPTREETVAALSRHRAELAELFRVPTPRWDVVKWAWDKRNTYQLAEELEQRFSQAAALCEDGEVMVQELLAGDGLHQFAYCAFFKDGKALGSMVARRRRQHPPDFGRASTYVETVELPELEELSERFLRAIGYYGLVELEYKLDPRDGRHKLLDVNARTWGYHTLGQRAGVDFPAMLFADQVGESVKQRRSAPGVRWIRLVTDVPMAAVELVRGRLDVLSYTRSLVSCQEEAVFSTRDPLPGLVELALLPYLALRRGL